MKKCHCCGIIKSKTFHCRRCGSVACLTCFDFDYWLCAWCREVTFMDEYKTKQKYTAELSNPFGVT